MKCALVAAACVLVHATAVAAPLSVKATYAASMNGIPIGTIAEQFEAQDGQYRIVSDTKPSGLAALIQRQPLRFSSSGTVTQAGLRPSQFEARRAATDPPQVSADFDWPQNQLVLKRGGVPDSISLPAGTQDRLSIMYQFMFMPLEQNELELPMTDGRKLNRYRYRVTPDVEIETGIGRVKTIHLVKITEPGDAANEVWLSREHRNFPVRMLIVERDGVRFEQVVQSLELRD